MSSIFEMVRHTRNMSMSMNYENGVVLTDSVSETCVKRPLAYISRWRHNRLAKNLDISEIMHRRKNVTMERHQEVMVALSKSVMKNRVLRPPGGEITTLKYPVGNKTSLSRKPCIADKKLLWNAIRKSRSLSNFYIKKQISIKKTYQFINFVYIVSRSHKTPNIFFFIWLVSVAC